MSSEPLPQANPFPIEAVATFGNRLTTSAVLEYMSSVGEELHKYLGAHLREKTRFGGAIGLRGGHGAGKTHLLNWLGELARGTRSIRCEVLYGKCDSSSFFDFYKQLMAQLPRQQLIDLVQLAFLNLARRKVRSAEITAALADRLETVGALSQLQDEGNIDLEELRQQLLEQLDSSSSATMEMARLLLAVADSRFGADAYRWLSGLEIEQPELLGVPRSMTNPGTTSSPDADTAAIAALEIIAALHRIAGVPLLILMDQLEVLLNVPDPNDFITLGSLLKKFIELLARQCVLVVIAGAPPAWSKLPRDIPPRFQRREPVAVGGLTADETRLLIKAYLSNLPEAESLPDRSYDIVQELSGGNPREILRISHEAFEATSGNLSLADREVLLASAQRSGSIADRAELALTIADAVLQGFGAISRELTVDGETVDRVLTNDLGVLLVLFVVKATDAIQEINSARRVTRLQKYLRANWRDPPLIVVAVGYSSPEVRSVLNFVAPIVFDERDFEGTLRAQVIASVNARGVPAVVRPDEDKQDDALARSIALLTSRLDEIETKRATELDRVFERFVGSTRELSAPATAARELKTRQEILDALESLSDAIHRDDQESERAIIRSVLLANETHLHNRSFEELGELYRDVLALERSNRYSSIELRGDRISLISRMRATLAAKDEIFSLTAAVRIGAIAFLVLLGLDLITGLISASLYSEKFKISDTLYLPEASNFVSTLPFLFLYATGAAILLEASLAYVWFMERMSSNNRIKRLRARLVDERPPAT